METTEVRVLPNKHMPGTVTPTCVAIKTLVKLPLISVLCRFITVGMASKFERLDARMLIRQQRNGNLLLAPTVRVLYQLHFVFVPVQAL